MMMFMRSPPDQADEDRRELKARRQLPDRRHGAPRVNWSAVAVVLTIIGWLLMAGTGFFGDYRKIADRVNALEIRHNDDVRRMQEQRAEDLQWRERMEDKVDKLIDRLIR